MDARTLEDLSTHLERCRRMAEAPPVLVLGAGASVKAGLADMKGLYRAAGIVDPLADDAFERFCAFIERRSAKERYLMLAEHLEVADPFVVTPGYDALAQLCAEGYFDVVLSTNLDPLLDDALVRAPLRRRDYVVLINGFLRPDLLGPVLSAARPRLKVIKLHGDLFHRQMAWTPAEMDSYVGSIAEELRELLRRRDVLVVGYSLRDPRVRQLVLATKGDLWMANPVGVPAHLQADFAQHSGVRTLLGTQGEFETLFTGLAARLRVGAAPAAPRMAAAPAAAPPSVLELSPLLGARAAPAAFAPGLGSMEPGVGALPDVVATVDDFTASVLGVAVGEAEPHGTAFLLASPRVIVTDGWSMAERLRAAPHAEIRLVTARGEQLVTRRLAQHAHPFGPALLEAPPELRGLGLRLRPRPLGVGDAIRVGIAVGAGRGVASGAVAAVDLTQAIGPLTTAVAGLVALACAVAPGASGAPVVDDRFQLAGFVVGGRDDAPESTMYPAAAWRDAVRSLGVLA